MQLKTTGELLESDADSDPGPLFDSNADATLTRVKAVFTQRGNEYADTWRNAQWLAMLAAAKELGLVLTTDQCRVLAAAALVDVKYARLEGGFKDDTGVDMIAYLANWLEEMRKLHEQNQRQHS